VLNYRFAWLTGGWLLVGLVVYLSLVQHPPEPLSFEHADKLEHVFAYAALSIWFCQIYLTGRSRMVVVIMLVGLGASLECLQDWMGFRNFESLDMVANTLGVLIGIILVQTPLGRLFVLIEKAMR